ncbi:TolC family protein [Tenacibaculum jejuense]|uniref:Outer membrane efflux protein n=1 Tax=Tenacibaculum jejuense TaxID=584609 RepID=A0A238UBM5_9FLAO|nr:TolC family protein [Tenacibaculum jejuense]SNR15884.1 Outer membrane efflux protein precursor [Tenacibaculum jejuense]
MKKLFTFFSVILSLSLYAQTNDILSLSEYIGYVKEFHPIVKQAQLVSTEGEIKLLKARGAFDPKISVDYDRKKFKKTEYFDKLNTTFKIPTWYGVEFKANYEKNTGIFLNPEANVPDQGLYGAGVSVSLARGLLMNNRMATLKQAKLYTKQANAKQKLLVNDILYDAIVTYFEWLKNFETQNTYNDFLSNATNRLDIVKKSFNAGDKPAVDTLEANINFKSRQLDLEKAKLKYLKSKLKLANFLWLENNIPLELEDNITPDLNTLNIIDNALNIENQEVSMLNVNNHLKMKSLNYKKEGLLVNKRLKFNNLLPRIDLEYNFLSPQVRNLSNFDTNNYKGGVNVYIPLFLRKERAELKLAKLKLQDIDFVISASRMDLNNKMRNIENEISSTNRQSQILTNLVVDYDKLVKAEERMFILGEGSLFRINYREVKLIETRLKLIDTKNKFLKSKASLYQMINNQDNDNKKTIQ